MGVNAMRREGLTVDPDSIRRKADKTCEIVALTFNVSPAELAAPTRCKAPIAFARQVAMYLCNVAMGLSFSQIAETFRRDRTTVSHACHLIEDCRDEPEFDARLDALELVLKTSCGEGGRQARASAGGMP